MNNLAILALEYMEPDYQQTMKCLVPCQEAGADVFFVSRDGVGNMSRAFNDGFARYVKGKGYEYVWLLTNVVFEPHVPKRLLHAMTTNADMAAIHPACAASDHAHLHPRPGAFVQDVPFVELMAPMLRVDAFAQVGLQEELWYWYMDLVLSYEVKKRGWRLGCDHMAQVSHTYLRNAAEHPITRVRKELRELLRSTGQRWLVANYGPNWRKVLGWKE